MATMRKRNKLVYGGVVAFIVGVAPASIGLAHVLVDCATGSDAVVR